MDTCTHSVYRFRRETQVCKAISQPASLLERKILFLPFKAICFTNILKLFQNKEQLVTYKINRKCRGVWKIFPQHFEGVCLHIVMLVNLMVLFIVLIVVSSFSLEAFNSSLSSFLVPESSCCLVT